MTVFKHTSSGVHSTCTGPQWSDQPRGEPTSISRDVQASSGSRAAVGGGVEERESSTNGAREREREPCW